MLELNFHRTISASGETMGKSSKSKSKKSAKQERAKHLNIVEIYEKTLSTFDKKFYSLGVFRKRERNELSRKQIQLTLGTEESYAFINRYQLYKSELSRVCSCLLFDLILSANFIQASNSLNDMMYFPLTKEFRGITEPFSKVLLLWVGKGNGNRKDAIAKITENAFDVIHRPEARDFIWLLFLDITLDFLIRQPIADQYFETVEFLSLATLRNVGECEFEEKWINQARLFLVFSYIEKFRFYFLEGQETGKIQASLEEIRKMKPFFSQLSTSGIGHLANSLLEYCTFIYGKEEHSSESVQEISNKIIESLEKYIALKRRDLQSECHTCRDKDTPNHENLVCQGCRVVSYCCKDHQRFNYLHHEQTGTRGLGHKYLCPVFKAYRRKMNNTDASKQGHLERKFQRACKRFLRGTMEINLQQKFDPV